MRLCSYMCVRGNCSGTCYCSWNKAKSHLTVLSFKYICPLKLVEWVFAKCVIYRPAVQQLHTDIPVSLLNLGSSPPLHHRYPQDDHSIHSWKKNLKWKNMPSKSKGAWQKFPLRAIEQFMRKINAFHTPILSIYSIIHLNIYSRVFFYIVVFGMTLVWSISTNAPEKGDQEHSTKQRFLFPG